jgi:hypothetical protein
LFFNLFLNVFYFVVEIVQLFLLFFNSLGVVVSELLENCDLRSDVAASLEGRPASFELLLVRGCKDVTSFIEEVFFIFNTNFKLN